MDTSALVALLAQEEDGPQISAQLQNTDAAITAPHVLLESVMVLSTQQRITPAHTLVAIERALAECNVVTVPITTDVARIAIDAFARYGKGQGHPAQLNFGDCLSYGCAKVHGVPLLFKGSDFQQTDIARA